MSKDKIEGYELNETKLWREIQIMEQINHPNIVEVREILQNESYYFFVTEYLSGGSLYDLVMNRKKT